MKFKKPICLLCIIVCLGLLLCGCIKPNEPSRPDNGEISGEQEKDSGENGDETDRKSFSQNHGLTEISEFANMIFRLTPDNFFDFFHYRIESADQGGEYDVLTYSVESNASSDDIHAFLEGVGIDLLFDVEIKYVKEYTEDGLIYDTLNYSLPVFGNSDVLNGTVDISQIPVFKRNAADTDHKIFTVLNVTPHINSVAGVISYAPTAHTYIEPVTYETIPGFEVTATNDGIVIYMIPENNNYLYNNLSVEIELRYTSDTSDKPDQFIRFNEGRITMEGNLGGYGQFYHKIAAVEDDISKVVVSVINISGSVVKSKGCTVFEPAK